MGCEIQSSEVLGRGDYVWPPVLVATTVWESHLMLPTGFP